MVSWFRRFIEFRKFIGFKEFIIMDELKMSYQYSFERLHVWSNIREMIKHVYSITTRFPQEEKFGLMNQMRRAAFFFHKSGRRFYTNQCKRSGTFSSNGIFKSVGIIESISCSLRLKFA